VSGPPQREPNLAALGSEVASDVVRLVRAEITLAKEQSMAALKRLLVAAAILVIALMFLLFAVIMALATIPAGWTQSLFHSTWVGWLVFAGLLFVIALVVGLAGTMSLFRALRLGKQTLTTLKEDSEWVKQLTRRAGSGS
jgi:cation transport ATPase